MAKGMNFFKQQTHAVDLYHADLGDLGQGTLSFGSGNWAHVTFKGAGPSKKLVDEKTWHVIKARTSDGHSFSLFECKVHGFVLYADYVIDGDVDVAKFKRIDIRYSEISEWFLHLYHIEGTVGEKITWTEQPKQFSVNVGSGREQFTIRSEYVGSFGKQGEDHVLHEHVEFIFERTNGKFSLSDLQSKTLELSCLLSILIAYPISIISVEVMADDGRLYHAYFPTFKKVERDLSDNSFWIKCFAQKRAIEDRWQIIFENYYKSKYRKVSWVRLAGMQRYEGFWEYKALGYVSLLDKYVTQRVKGVKGLPATGPNPEKLLDLKNAIAQLSHPLVDGQRDELIDIVGRIFGKRERTFSQKYQLALADTDKDIVRIINLSDDDFKFIRRVRDAIAHGDDPGLQESDFGKVSVIVGRIALLLTYWAFLDFGLTTADFLECLSITHSRLRFDSQLDAIHLARVTKTAEFFNVSKTKFQALSKLKGLKVFACFVQDGKDEIEFSESYTKMYRDWQKNPSRKSGTYSYEEIFGVENDVIKIVGMAYIESGADQLELHHMLVFDGSRLQS